MKVKLLKIVRASIILGCLAGFTLLGLASRRAQSEKTCEGLAVEFSDSFNFVTEDDVKGYLDKYYGTYIGQRLDSLNLDRIEKMLDMQSAVLKSEVYVAGDCRLHVRISQREPVLRFQNGGTGFYIDSRGFIFPLQDNYTSLVPVIDGNIPVKVSDGYKGEAASEKEALWLKGVLEMTGFIQKSKIWSENVVQIHVDRNSDIVVVPREGKEVFIFGGPEEAARKFARVEKYYQYIKPMGKDYTNVNVKYYGQIICK